MAYYMYVSLQDDDKIWSYAMDSGTGKLTRGADMPAAGGDHPLRCGAGTKDGALGVDIQL